MDALLLSGYLFHEIVTDVAGCCSMETIHHVWVIRIIYSRGVIITCEWAGGRGVFVRSPASLFSILADRRAAPTSY